MFNNTVYKLSSYFWHNYISTSSHVFVEFNMYIRQWFTRQFTNLKLLHSRFRQTFVLQYVLKLSICSQFI